MLPAQHLLINWASAHRTPRRVSAAKGMPVNSRMESAATSFPAEPLGSSKPPGTSPTVWRVIHSSNVLASDCLEGESLAKGRRQIRASSPRRAVLRLQEERLRLLTTQGDRPEVRPNGRTHSANAVRSLKKLTWVNLFLLLPIQKC